MIQKIIVFAKAYEDHRRNLRAYPSLADESAPVLVAAWELLNPYLLDVAAMTAHQAHAVLAHVRQLRPVDKADERPIRELIANATLRFAKALVEEGERPKEPLIETAEQALAHGDSQ
jgi:hypothetical protein